MQAKTQACDQAFEQASSHTCKQASRVPTMLEEWVMWEFLATLALEDANAGVLGVRWMDVDAVAGPPAAPTPSLSTSSAAAVPATHQRRDVVGGVDAADAGAVAAGYCFVSSGWFRDMPSEVRPVVLSLFVEGCPERLILAVFDAVQYDRSWSPPQSVRGRRREQLLQIHRILR